MDPTLAYHSLALAAVREGAPIRRVINLLQDHWGAPALESLPFLKKNGDDDIIMPGDHAIPEIARQEKAFYNALTDGQKEAYQALAEMVDTMHATNKGWTGVDPWKIDEPIEAWKRKAFLALASHPMQAFMVGQMLANEAMKSATASALLPTDMRAIEFLTHHTFNEVSGLFEGLKTVLRAEMIDGMQNGDNPKEIARTIANAMGDYQRDFALVTITENTRAEAQGRLRELLDAGFDWAIGSSAHDVRTCDWCLEHIDGQKVKIADVIGLSNYGRKKRDWLQVIPGHPKCRCLWLPWTPESEAIIGG